MTLADLSIVATVSTIEVISLKILSYKKKKESNLYLQSNYNLISLNDSYFPNVISYCIIERL